MEKYDRRKGWRCPKCLYRGHKIEYVGPYGRAGGHRTIMERLMITCSVCGYSEDKLCADAEEK